MIDSRSSRDEYIRADLERFGLSRWRWRFRITRRQAYFLWLLRRYEYRRNTAGTVLGTALAAALNIRLRFLAERLGFTIPPNTCGPGLHLPHYGTIVVNTRARIGAGVTLAQGVTVGMANGEAPVIGDRCHLGPNVVVLGGVQLGENVGVWANSVVRSDLPAFSDAAGAPAVVKRQREVPPEQ